MKFFEFLWYCIKCMIKNFSTLSGHIPNGHSGKDIAIGFITLIVLLSILSFICWLIAFLCKKHKKKKNSDKNSDKNTTKKIG